jgi:hypothetical protein
MLKNLAVILSNVSDNCRFGYTLLVVSGKSDTGNMQKQRAGAFPSIWLPPNTSSLANGYYRFERVAESDVIKPDLRMSAYILVPSHSR